MADNKTIADVVAAAQAASGKTASLIAAFAAAKAKVEELLANQMTPELQEGLNAIFDLEAADAQAIDGALNTPPTP